MFPLTHIVDRAAAYHARRAAAVQGGLRLTYGEVTRRAAALAGGMLARGIRPGDRVAILSRNNFRYLEVNLACAYAGIILIPLNHRLAAKEIDGILARTETRLLFQALPYEPEERRGRDVGRRRSARRCQRLRGDDRVAAAAGARRAMRSSTMSRRSISPAARPASRRAPA